MKSSKIDVSPLTKKVHIRNEIKADYETIEEITRRAFWNLHAPGCDEHYLVHIMRSHKDFLPALDFVIEVDDMLIGNIMYTKAKLVDEEKERIPYSQSFFHAM